LESTQPSDPPHRTGGRGGTDRAAGARQESTIRIKVVAAIIFLPRVCVWALALLDRSALLLLWWASTSIAAVLVLRSLEWGHEAPALSSNASLPFFGWKDMCRGIALKGPVNGSLL
jgi:hypothetical protein